MSADLPISGGLPALFILWQWEFDSIEGHGANVLKFYSLIHSSSVRMLSDYWNYCLEYHHLNKVKSPAINDKIISPFPKLKSSFMNKTSFIH